MLWIPVHYQWTFKYFLPFCGLLSFGFLYGVLKSTNVLSFDEVQFIFFVVIFAHLVLSRKRCQIQSHEDLFLCFLLNVFIVLAFIFRYLIRLELILTYGVRKGSNWRVGIQLSPQHLMKILLTLDQHGFELGRPTYNADSFFNK